MRIIKNFAWNVGYQIFVLLVPLVTVPYVNRVLGPTGVGINAFTNSNVQYFILIGSLGVNLYANRGTAYRRDDPEQLEKYFWEVSAMRFVTISIACCAYLVFVWFNDQYRLFYLAQGISLIGVAFDISWFFQGMENFRVTVLRNLIVKLISLALIFTFVRHESDTALYILILSGASFFGNLTFWPSVHRYIKHWPRVATLNIRQHFKPSFMMLIPQLATQIYLQLNKTMLGVLLSVSAAGFYDNSDKIVKMLLALVTATGTVLLPHVAHSFAKGDQQAVKRSLNISMHLILVMALPLAFGIAAVANSFTYYFFSAKFMPVADLMAVEAIVVIPISIASAIGVQYLLPTNQMKPYTTSVVLGSITNIVLNVPLILTFGTMGAIVSTVLSETMVTLYQIFYVRKQLDLRALFAETWKYALAGLVMFICVKLLDSLVARSVVMLIVEVGVGILVYMVTLLILRPRIVLNFVFDFIKKYRVKGR
jgi:O-antigen/teichoic acid export membrane protein